mmetsp:Transcript_17356/g.42447  ORF Transcript_17356/g.42447 Transcript_17356/m.42447 type:complete len:459 (-) Transcript_17356:319-1695(-)
MGIQNTKAKQEIKRHKVSSTLERTAQVFHVNKGRNPIAGIDISVWIMMCLSNQRVVDQFHADPKVPLTAVSETIMNKINVFLSNGWGVLMVFDGQRNPLKAETNEKRKGDLEGKKRRLARALRAPDEVSVRAIAKLRKDTVWPRDDIYGEVIRALKQNKVPVFGAPFETDHQMVALQRQGMIDYVVSTDTDMPFLGISKTIYNVNYSSGRSRGRCDILELHGPNGLFEKFFKKKFACENVSLDDVGIFACLLGNDFVKQLSEKLRYSGIVEIMKQLTALQTTSEKKDFFTAEILPKYADPAIKERFCHAVFFWKHAPVYFVTPTVASDSPRIAFQKGQYSVSLRGMDTDESSANSQFYTPVKRKMGFDPFEILRKSHTEVMAGEEGSDEAFVNLDKWSRTGLEFGLIPPQTNGSGKHALALHLGTIKQPIAIYSLLTSQPLLTCDARCRSISRFYVEF